MLVSGDVVHKAVCVTNSVLFTSDVMNKRWRATLLIKSVITHHSDVAVISDTDIYITLQHSTY